MKRVEIEAIVDAYRDTGSVWKAGKRVGLSGQQVHTRLVAHGYKLSGRKWSAEERQELHDLIGAGLTLGAAAHRLGRSFNSAATQASRMGLRTRSTRTNKIPRGAGYDKVSMKKNFDALDAYDGTVTQFARSRGLAIENFVQACQRHFPERWDGYVANHSEIATAACPYCEREFIPNSGKQRYCTRKCANDARTDASYFGGRRREAIGLVEGICQLCGREGTKRLAAHHVLGKENDPDDSYLIALCNGCHQMVGHLAGRKFADDPVGWESLIALVWLRRNGGALPADSDGVHVTVDIDTYLDEEGQ